MCGASNYICLEHNNEFKEPIKHMHGHGIGFAFVKLDNIIDVFDIMSALPISANCVLACPQA